MRGRAFELEQFRFRLEPACKAGKFARGTDHTMTRHDDRKRIVTIGQPHRPRSGRIADFGGQATVAPSLAVWDAKQLLPHPSLKCRPAQRERQFKCRPLALKVLGQLSVGLTQDRMMKIFTRPVQLDAGWAVVGPEHRDEARLVGDQLEPSYRRICEPVRQHSYDVLLHGIHERMHAR